jgi:hypothetical protein
MAPEVQTTATMSDTDHGAPGATATHDAGHGHDEHGHATDSLGSIDWPMWSIGLLGVVVAIATTAAFAMATGFNFGV